MLTVTGLYDTVINIFALITSSSSKHLAFCKKEKYVQQLLYKFQNNLIYIMNMPSMPSPLLILQLLEWRKNTHKQLSNDTI